MLELDRVADLALEAANATAVHVLRIVGIVSSMLGRAAHEVADLALIYQDLASDLSNPDRGAGADPGAASGEPPWTATKFQFEPSLLESRQQLN